MSPDPVTYSWRGFWIGFRLTLPVALGTFGYGLVYGTLSREAGLTMAEAILSSALIYAGTAQLVILEQWSTHIPILTMVVTVLVVNARHLLMGATLAPWLKDLPRPRVYASAFFINDESWALTLRDLRAGSGNGAFLLGSGVILLVAWVSSTVIGRVVGGTIDDPSRWGLDVAFTAVFAALIAGLWEGRRSLSPWAVAAAVAVLAERWLPGVWYIPLGGIAGSAVGAMRRDG